MDHEHQSPSIVEESKQKLLRSGSSPLLPDNNNNNNNNNNDDGSREETPPLPPANAKYNTDELPQSHSHHPEHNVKEKQWIRGVNIGGWLLAEQFITPYLFAINTCHLEGDFCWYPGQIGSDNEDDDKTKNICNPNHCQPVQNFIQTDGNSDYHPLHAKPYMGYPIDELTLGQTFTHNKTLGRLYMERHWDTFVTRENLIDLKQAGITHLRVPMGYWIRGGGFLEQDDDEPYIGGSWPYFVRFAHWCREIGLEVWADLHGVPGSQNGFDNSGQQKLPHTCDGWSKNATNVERTVTILTDIVKGIADEDLQDVVTGMGLLNEPMLDCDETVLRNYYHQGLSIVRSILGPTISVFVGDMFQSWRFNNGFWSDEANTYIDTHQYQVFFEKGRAFTPKQHIAYLCRHNAQEVVGCCYEDAPNNTIPTKGVRKIIGEWTGSYDALPTAMAPYIMKTIAATGSAPHLNRTLSKARKEFLQNFVKAQMIVYEAKDHVVSNGWFFWNFQMEGGAYAEWDFLRGIEEGWMPTLPDPTVASEDLYGSCLDIYNQTNGDYTAVVDEYPHPRDLDWSQYQGWDATDDFVMSDPLIPEPRYGPIEPNPHSHWTTIAAIIIIAGLLGYYRRKWTWNRRDSYEELK